MTRQQPRDGSRAGSAVPGHTTCVSDPSYAPSVLLGLEVCSYIQVSARARVEFKLLFKEICSGKRQLAIKSTGMVSLLQRHPAH